MAALLDELGRRYPLPGGWKAPDLFAETVVVARSAIALSGFSTLGPRGEQVTGSAGGEAPLERSYFELLERVSVVSAMRDGGDDLPLRNRQGDLVGTAPRAEVFPETGDPRRSRHSLSSGVALHLTWAEACDRALAELVERDRVLRSWYGDVAPRPMALAEAFVPEGLREVATWSAYEIADRDALDVRLSVAAVVGIPKVETIPLTYGFAARSSAGQALEAALQEAVQRFGFLFGEEIPRAVPDLTPNADYHQEYYLYPPSLPLLQGWLDDGRANPQATHSDARDRGSRSPAVVRFVDLTPGHLRGSIFVAKALCSAAEPLVFGEPAPHRRNAAPDRRVHPIA